MSLVKIIGVVLLASIALVVAGWLLQRRLIYLPSGVPGVAPAGWRDITLATADGFDLGAWLARPESNADCGKTIIVFPGNAGNRADRLPLGDRLVAAGLTVVLVDYRGYGGNPGSPSESGLREDARAALAFVHDAGLGEEGVVYFGESLGSGVAVGLATESPPDAMVLRSPFTSLTDAARHHFSWLPVQWLLRDRFPSLERAPLVGGVPTLVIAGTADRTVPFDQSLRLATALGAEFHPVEGADHNDADLTWDADLVRVVTDFLGCGTP